MSHWTISFSNYTYESLLVEVPIKLDITVNSKKFLKIHMKETKGCSLCSAFIFNNHESEGCCCLLITTDSEYIFPWYVDTLSVSRISSEMFLRKAVKHFGRFLKKRLHVVRKVLYYSLSALFPFQAMILQGGGIYTLKLCKELMLLHFYYSHLAFFQCYFLLAICYHLN